MVQLQEDVSVSDMNFHCDSQLTERTETGIYRNNSSSWSQTAPGCLQAALVVIDVHEGQHSVILAPNINQILGNLFLLIK